MSNQTALHNGCVCDSGCEACDRLAEAFEAMREALYTLVNSNHTYEMDCVAAGENIQEECPAARAALALADKVRQ